MNSELQTLANAFHAAAVQMQEPPKMSVYRANGTRVPPDPTAEISRRISADVLKAIGDVYAGQAAQDA